MSDAEELERWCDVLAEAFSELAESALFVEDVDFTRMGWFNSKDVPGSYIPLVGDSGTYTFGIQGSWKDFSKLSRRFLFLGEEEEISNEEVVDAVNELCNIMVGGVKRRMVTYDPSLKLGLPSFFTGSIHVTSDQEARETIADMETERFHLVAVKRRAV